MSEDQKIWAIIVCLGLGTFAIRFSFIGLVGDREMPLWFRRLLRYVPVAVLPAVVAPLVVFPQATGGAPDLPRLIAAATAMAVGIWRGGVVETVLSGMIALYLALWLLG